MSRAIGDDNPPEEMDDETLLAAWELADEGRQYDGVEADRRAIGREMAERLRAAPDTLDVYVGGEPVIVRGVEREVAEPAGNGPDEFIDLWFHVDFVDYPERKTNRFNISQMKAEGGLSALMDHVQSRGLTPDWYHDNGREVPDSLD